ncbi:MgtC/SapB family protein [Rhodopirellula sp. P2]|uniref:MgtC/SapB family protein n=1 Tax=Rhodopirellula sp. P2 TaxID=2127060 RepID=UPI0023679CC8|nr:MgtC/SapB family protein [Rhodopirellula sp. P2]WDQ16753.1 MgtC/SapB family protein [Rhodopirellula sp. P2]
MTFFDTLIPTLAAVLLGGAIGLERQTRGHAAGLRTHILVSLAASVFVLASREMTSHSGGDMTRVVQGIAAGVGFIGAGAILKMSQEHEVIGLTSASTIWLAAAVGTACGLREFPLAVTSVVMTVVVLVILQPIEARFDRKQKPSNDQNG